MGRKVDYDHLHNEIMGAIKVVSEDTDGKLADRFGTMIDFLETMYVNSVLSLTGALLATAKHSTNEEVSNEGLIAARDLLQAPPVLVQRKLESGYKELIEQLNLPDVFQVKTHNEKVAEEILDDIEG